MKNVELSSLSLQSVRRESLREELQLHSEKCFECKLCLKECAFLQKYGSPKQLADTYGSPVVSNLNIGFECSLCGLCSAVCPAALDPAAMFLEMRREAVDRGAQDLARYRILLNYEKRGTSKRFSWHGLPENCRTVLFPGCALSGSRPGTVKKLYDHLRRSIPDLGIILDCCSKPSRDLGREKQFHTQLDDMKAFLVQHGVEKILVACPSCWQIFRDYAEPLEVETVYEYLVDSPSSSVVAAAVEATIHDACITRENTKLHHAVRRIAAESPLAVREMEHRGMKTLCCGEGGAVQYINPEFSGKWTRSRIEEADGRTILTYCAGCSHFLGRKDPAYHILDVFFDADKVLSGKVKVAKTPVTYLNRLYLKSYFRKHINSSISRERDMSKSDNGAGGSWKKIVFLACLVTLLAVVGIPFFFL